MFSVDEYLTQHAERGAASVAICYAATCLLDKVERLLADPECPSPNPGLRSGWRPPAVNALIPGAAPNSEHQYGHAVDLDDNDGALDAWLTDDILKSYDLYREAPSHTGTWCHLQDMPPPSGHRTFIP
jgi:hypothetical protein